MKIYWKHYNESEWQGPLECNHITFHVNFIYCYKEFKARNLIRTFDTRQLYKFSIENDEKK